MLETLNIEEHFSRTFIISDETLKARMIWASKAEEIIALISFY